MICEPGNGCGWLLSHWVSYLWAAPVGSKVEAILSICAAECAGDAALLEAHMICHLMHGSSRVCKAWACSSLLGACTAAFHLDSLSTERRGGQLPSVLLD